MDANAPHHRRKLTRCPVANTVDVYNVLQGALLGRLVNVHREGLMLMSDTPIVTNHLYHLKLMLPTPLLGVDVIELTADCLWSRSIEGSTACWSGFHVIDISEKNLQLVEHLVDQFSEQ